MIENTDDIRGMLRQEISVRKNELARMEQAFNALSGGLAPGELADLPTKRGPGRPKGSRNQGPRKLRAKRST